MKNENGRDSLFISSIQKGIKILDAYNDGTRRISLTEMVSRTGLNKSSVQRFVYTWEKLGYLEKEHGSKQYQLTPKTLNFSYNYLRANPLVEIATAYFIYQRNLHDHTFNLSILDGAEVVYIVRIPKFKQPLPAHLLGRRLPAVCTSGGRAILSKLTDAEIWEIIDQSVVTKRTPYTTTDHQEIFEEIQKVKEQGFAITNQQCLIGEIVVAAPVLNTKGHPVGAVLIPNSIAEWPLDRVRDELAPIAIEAARAIVVP